MKITSNISGVRIPIIVINLMDEQLPSNGSIMTINSILLCKGNNDNDIFPIRTSLRITSNGFTVTVIANLQLMPVFNSPLNNGLGQ